MHRIQYNLLEDWHRWFDIDLLRVSILEMANKELNIIICG